ncbi:MAG: NHLP leader peptide family RiPP precursor [Brooklawnia sp.]|uniref:NHLP leader peptide family RiPP precursor n=1 Tax=Brooklawnia sp. TaxID=2699740 RepID=UPI003C7598E2
MTEQTITTLPAEVNERVMRDKALRKRLLENPHETLRADFGIGIPEDLRIEVHEETSDVIHLVIPGAVKRPRIQDIELEDVAMIRPRGKKTECCTCGMSTSQSAVSVQKGCGC